MQWLLSRTIHSGSLGFELCKIDIPQCFFLQIVLSTLTLAICKVYCCAQFSLHIQSSCIMSTKILVINPNSSKKVSNNLEAILKPPPNTTFEYYTAPPDGPEEITPELSEISCRVALPDLLSKEKNIFEIYDGFLVCCYSDHPLIHSLSQYTSKPVLGIMQATLLYALSQPNVKKSFILTSVNEWEPVLDKGIIDFVGTESFPSGKFQKTKGLDVNVLSLSDPSEFAKIVNRVKQIIHEEYKNDSIDCVLLGCAGMAGLDEKLSESFPGIQFIDSVKIGVELLGGLIGFRKNQS